MYRLEFTPGECEVMTSVATDQPTGEWMAERVIVPEGPGKGAAYDPSLTPYFPPLWDILFQPWVREMFLCAGPQIGKTLFGQGFLARRGIERPGPRHVALPDEGLTENWFDKKLIPFFMDSPKLRRLVAGARHSVVKTEINLTNGTAFTGRWMGSVSNRASLSALDGLGDEPDMFPEGAAADFRERFRSYEHLYKILWIGKPIGFTDESWIQAQLETADVVYHYEARCPACGTYQRMEFDSIRVASDRIMEVRDPAVIRQTKAAYYECGRCQWLWTDQIRDRAVRHGRWVADREVDRPVTVAAHLPSWYSRWVSLSSVMADWLAAQGKPDKLKSWWNGYAAKTADVVATESSEERLRQLVVPELPPQVVPDRAQTVTVSIDMQKDHFYYSVCAHWVDPESEADRAEDWIIDQGRVSSFAELSELVYGARFRREGTTGQHLGVWRAALDTGGGRNEWENETRTMQAYKWLLKQRPGVVFGTKGMSRADPGIHVKFKMLQKLPNGRALKRGLRLYFIDTDAFKDLLFWRLSDEAKESGGQEPIRFHAKTPDEYFYQLASEKKVLEKGKYIWKRIRANHWLDCMIGHLAMTHWQWGPSLKTLVARAQAAQPTAQAPATGGPGKRINPYTGREV
ncbi:terminase gpA endonuclease subunit [Pseudodesulfovibrio pelocollis]|uniref:terminase gpA endonuclease subunit n=1 Tax=Pseudodesulfovibrio pelocollis TaxID=3051432 RepID=UPI00255B0DA3|nr:terminase gpA endonuclease subunit [Pseudodesulfovibrio sp. SB368]